MSHRGITRGSTWREANAKGLPRRMEVSIPQNNLRVFAAAVQCLMKVGKELFIEVTTDQLILRTLNDAKSAFAAFYFNEAAGFFESYRCEQSASSGDRSQCQDASDSQESAETAAGGGGNVSCKIQVRAVHSILRTLKKVVRLVIYVEAEDDHHIEPHIVFQMYCEYGYRKVHRLSLQDCEIMHAVFEPEGASRLSCPPVQLSQLLEHIHGTAEVAVGASYDVLTVRSFHHPLTGSAERAVLKTEMSISTAEFDTYSFCGGEDEEVELVFSLKEVKALLHFCESAEAQSLEMLFREGGDPLLFQSHSNTFAGELIMATMEPRIIRDNPERVVAGGGRPNDARDYASSPRGHDRGEGRQGGSDHHERSNLGSEGHRGEDDRGSGTNLQGERRAWRRIDRTLDQGSDARDPVESGDKREQRGCNGDETRRGESSDRNVDEGGWPEGKAHMKGPGSREAMASGGDEEEGDEESQATRTPASNTGGQSHEGGSWDGQFGRGDVGNGYAMGNHGRRGRSPPPREGSRRSRVSQASDKSARESGLGGRSGVHPAAGRPEPEPQSEMPTQFHGLRGALHSADEDSADLLGATLVAVSGMGGARGFANYCNLEDHHPRDQVGGSPELPVSVPPRRGGEGSQGQSYGSHDSDEGSVDPIHVPGKRKRRVVQDDEEDGEEGGEEAGHTKGMYGDAYGGWRRGDGGEDDGRRA